MRGSHCANRGQCIAYPEGSSINRHVDRLHNLLHQRPRGMTVEHERKSVGHGGLSVTNQYSYGRIHPKFNTVCHKSQQLYWQFVLQNRYIEIFAR